jgi:DNA polymerase-4
MMAHLDLDAFFAAVELHRRPELRGTPLVVGGDPRGRGVVSTASYEARKYGIRSAMSCAEALRRCPQAVFVRPDHAAYREWSRRVWDTVRAHAPVVERIGIDEGYLVLAEGDPPEQAAIVQQAIREQVRLSSSLGVGACKVVCKIASDMKKPGGITYVPHGQEAAFLAPLEVRRLPGVGPKSEQRLTALGIETIGALAALHDEQMR